MSLVYDYFPLWPKGMSGAAELCDALGQNTTLKTLDLAFNSLGNQLSCDVPEKLGRVRKNYLLQIVGNSNRQEKL